MHCTPAMNTYCVNSIFFVNKDSRKALELNEGKKIGIHSHMFHEYYLETFLSLDELILCIDSNLAVKNISELESPFTEHTYWDPNKKKEVIRNILHFFRSEFIKLSSTMPTLPASGSGPGYDDARLMALYSKPDLLSFVDDFSDEEFKRFYIGNLLKLVNYIRHHLNPSDRSEITEITIYDFISLLLRYYNKDIQILKVVFESASSSASNSEYGHNRTLGSADQPAASPAAAAVAAAAAHVPLTTEAFDKLYAHIKCPSRRRTAINFGDPDYKRECTHKNDKNGGAKKRSRRLRRGKSKSKFQRRSKSIKRRRRH